LKKILKIRRTNWQSTDNDAKNGIVPFEILYVVIIALGWICYGEGKCMNRK